MERSRKWAGKMPEGFKSCVEGNTVKMVGEEMLFQVTRAGKENFWRCDSSSGKMKIAVMRLER